MGENMKAKDLTDEELKREENRIDLLTSFCEGLKIGLKQDGIRIDYYLHQLSQLKNFLVNIEVE